uniref:Uncharacterized protein n=1 Tax=Pithovirus LCPAC403 TaxID=2506596 RepID=A0A481ZAW0_9VIRU|nr:MAG: hypothetical protein LCPAC403_01880 [Pithovirus LCPAC403]
MEDVKCTIVSAFIVIDNERRDSLDYDKQGRIFLEIDVPKIVFMDREMIEHFQKFSNEKTVLIPFDKEEMLMWSSVDEKIEMPTNRCVKKDSKEYMMCMNTKTEWIRRAIELDLFHTEYFAWIDFGISYICSDIDRYKSSLEKISKTEIKNGKIRAPQISTNIDVTLFYDRIFWFFAGGLFGGCKKVLLEFDKLASRKFKETVESGRICWEVNIWFKIYLDNKDVFDMYKADHNLSMLENF